MFKNLSDKTCRKMLAVMTVILCCSLLLNIIYWSGAFGSGSMETEETAESVPGDLSHEGYKLEQVVIMSRHNIRAPLSSNGSVANDITPHTWIEWSSNSSELSLRGGALETEMGMYFRKWMEDESLIPDNYRPEEGEVRVYANAKQRTIATAQFFTAGMMPSGNIPIETHAEFSKMDPVFALDLTFSSDSYAEAVKEQIAEIHGQDIQNMKDNYELLSEVLDVEESKLWKDGSFSGFSTDDMNLIIEKGKEPGMTGSLKTASTAADALVLQYYEEKDSFKAAFNTGLTAEQWKEIADIKTLYTDVLFSTPLTAVNFAHPLLSLIREELNTEGRTFTFLCGHDSNIAGILTALKKEDYLLPLSVEAGAPIGSKLVFSRWSSPDDQRWISVDLVYQTTDQLRGMTLLDLEHHPAVCSMSFENLQKNEDGLYKEEEFMERLQDAVAAYDEVKELYNAE